MKIREWYHSRYVDDLRVMMMHEAGAIPYLQKAIEDQNPDIIIELGTANAGLTLALHECKRQALLFSFDLMSAFVNPKCLEDMTEQQIDYFLRNGFNGNVNFIIGDILSIPFKPLIKILKRDKRKFLYCDNGGKGKEITMYSQYLRPGDMLGVHDWGVEVNIKTDGVEKALENFERHYLNELFKHHNFRTRLFLR
ncbi:unnamed protein product [marine sediment metagenome]|uniref:O-methyltransferase domain-containing protein n=1 Tax=marine sediment metagenome TaxID=412755 RepID=X1B583_9ZZZZ